MPCDCEVELKDAEQAKVLWVLLAINAAMFLIEGAAGIIAHSAGLVADSLDMLADAAVYGVSLYVVGRSVASKVKAAYGSGILECLLGLGVLAEVVRRAIMGSEPTSLLMWSVGSLALAANLTCMALLSKHRDGEIHMRASWIFSTNDVLANLGVILAGVLVALLHSPIPDLVIGAIIAVVVVTGGIRIIVGARRESAAACLPDDPGA